MRSTARRSFPTCSTRWRAPASSTSSPARTTRSSASRCARACGLEPRLRAAERGAARLRAPASIPGRMVLPARRAGLPPVLGLSFDTQAALADDPAQSAIREVTLSLDVPQVDRAEQPFVRMREAAVGAGRGDGRRRHRRQRPAAARRGAGRHRRRPRAALRHAGRARPGGRLGRWRGACSAERWRRRWPP